MTDKQKETISLEDIQNTHNVYSENDINQFLLVFDSESKEGMFRWMKVSRLAMIGKKYEHQKDAVKHMITEGGTCYVVDHSLKIKIVD